MRIYLDEDDMEELLSSGKIVIQMPDGQRVVIVTDDAPPEEF